MQPTDKQAGRPRGSGIAGERDPARIMVRLSPDVYDALHERATQLGVLLAVYARQILEQSLTAPEPPESRATHARLTHLETTMRRVLQVLERQPASPPAQPGSAYSGVMQQLERPMKHLETSIQQLEIQGETSQQRKIPSQHLKTSTQQLESLTEPTSYDTSKFYLGKLCPRGHMHGDSGLSLLRRHNNRCRECENAAKRAARVRQKATAQEG